MTDLRPEFLAYLAGYLDGEGCIACYRHGNATSRLVQVGSEVRGTLELFQGAFGGAIYQMPRRPRKDGRRTKVFVWRARGKAEMAGALRQLLPYLRLKKEQAVVLLAEIDGFLTGAEAAHRLHELKTCKVWYTENEINSKDRETE